MKKTKKEQVKKKEPSAKYLKGVITRLKKENEALKTAIKEEVESINEYVNIIVDVDEENEKLYDLVDYLEKKVEFHIKISKLREQGVLGQRRD